MHVVALKPKHVANRRWELFGFLTKLRTSRKCSLNDQRLLTLMKNMKNEITYMEVNFNQSYIESF